MLNKEKIGIVAMSCYYPKLYVDQEELECYDKVSTGKYTIGLGQRKLSFTNDREDVCSLAMTVTKKLMDEYNLSYSEVGRLEVATETIQDHSKSIKTFLMDLFRESKNFNVEGVDSMNACYAATNALFNSVAWVESRDWNGKLALVVSVDISEYEKGPARPTGGCGAVAFAVGKDAVLSFEYGCRFSYMDHAFDFYKPNLASPFPVVDGHYSTKCYIQALDNCYRGYKHRFKKSHGQEISLVEHGIDFLVFHAPYNKLVQKSFARVLYNDYLQSPNHSFFDSIRDTLSSADPETWHTSRELYSALFNEAKELYETTVEPTTTFPKDLGNGYTSSLYLGLYSLLANKKADELRGKRITMFSYGSGLAASMFSFMVTNDEKLKGKLEKIIQNAFNDKVGLSKRVQKAPEFFEKIMEQNTKTYSLRSYEPESSLEDVQMNAFYLIEKDSKGRKSYSIRTK